MATDLILIHLAIVYGLDISGFVDDGIQPFFRKVFGHPLKSKPWLCSTCLSLWIGLVYLVFTKFSIGWAAFCLLLSYLAPTTKKLLLTVRDILSKALDQIATYLHLDE